MKPINPCLSLVLAAPLCAQTVSVTEVNTTFSTQIPVSTNPQSVFSVFRTAAVNHLYQFGWFFRVQGDPREYAFNAAPGNAVVAAQPSPSHCTVTWPDVEQRHQFVAMLDVEGFSDGTVNGHVVNTMTLINITPAPLPISLFAYVDWDVCNSATTETGSFNLGEHTVTSAGCFATCRLSCPGATATEVNYPTSFLNRLYDNLPIVLSGPSSGTFGPTDYAGLVQWAVQLMPGVPTSFPVRLSIDVASLPSYETYGSEGVGALGAPRIARYGPAVQGASWSGFQIQLSNAPANAPCLYLASIGTGFTPIQGIGVNVNLATMAQTFLLATSAGTAAYQFLLPPLPDFRGLEIAHQYLVADPTAANGFATWTRGLATRLGHL